MEYVLGIDLGTTNSCVALLIDNVPTVLTNRGGYKTTPSAFALDLHRGKLVGELAKRQAIVNAEGTITAFKRLIGRDWQSIERRKAQESASYNLVKGPNDDVRFEVFGKELSVPEVSSLILEEMKLIAEEALGRPLKKAVITVPAYFNDMQRQATKDAGRIAGLDVIRIINEPTAAALAYGFGKDFHKQIMVFDLGGGTFDVSILRIEDGVYEVIATGGDTYLGGEDFDRRIMNWLLSQVDPGVREEIVADKMTMQRIKEAAEKAKCELSFQRSTEINLPFLQTNSGGKGIHLQVVLSREALELLCEGLIDRTMTTCLEVLHKAGIMPSKLDEVLLVGGQTRMPIIRERLALITGKQPCKGVHPDEAVALGAAIQGSLIANPVQSCLSAGKDMLLLDVTPISLGIMILKGYFKVLIPANTTIPTSTSHVFTTVTNNQTQVKIRVFQGEEPMAEDNEFLGEFVLTDLRKAHRGEVNVEVSFDIDVDGIVRVRARDLETDREQAITVTASHGLSEEEISRLIEGKEGGVEPVSLKN